MAFDYDKKTEYFVGAKKLISLLFIIIITGGVTAHAEILECEVGDLSKGYWAYVSNECRIPGPPDPASQYLNDGNYYSSAFRIEGKYKVDTSMSWTTPSFVYQPPPCSQETCITGFREWMCNLHNNPNYNPPATFDMEGPLCVVTFYTGMKAYECYTDLPSVRLFEWKCYPEPPEPVEKNNNIGFPIPICQ
ncbi:MAG: hypothetical protein Q7W05_04190 [Deltaproteobacteria bacterium]|nr:hypothetical protein [Deltaproteobacteria bacterium]